MGQDRPHPQQQSQKDQAGSGPDRAQVQRGTQPDEEQRGKEALGYRKQLSREPARFSDGGHGQTEDEACEHDRHVGVSGDGSQQEENDQAYPQLEGEVAFLGDMVEPVAIALAF